MDYSTWNWITLIGSLAIFWSLDGWMAQYDSWQARFHRSDRNLTHGVNNILLAIVNTIVTLAFAALAGGIIYLVESNQWGLMSLMGVPFWVKLILGFLWVDFIIYFAHVLKHRWLWLWRLHLVHHNDTQVDATTSLRQHPGEAIVSFVFLAGSTVLLGIPALSVTIFYVIANPITVLQHVNIKVPAAIDRCLSYVLNTPNMHKVHHLEEIDLSNSNYGYVLSIWDRLFGTFIAPREEMEWKFGVAEYSTDESTKVLDLLVAPLEINKTASEPSVAVAGVDPSSDSSTVWPAPEND